MKEYYVILDVETTGLKLPEARVIKVNLLKTTVDGHTVEKMTEFINPGIHIPSLITRINGISNADVEQSPPFSALMDKFNAFIDGNPLVGYSIKAFDLPMFLQEFYSAGGILDISGGIIDLKEILFKKEPRSLAGAYKYYTERTKGKTEDVEAMHSIFQEQLRKYNIKSLSDTVAEFTEADTLDLAGKFRKDPNTGSIYFCFGKHSNKTLKYVEANDPEYISWVYSSSHAEETKRVLAEHSTVKPKKKNS